MRGLDFTSWQSLLATLASLALVALVGVGIRLVAMVAIQQRRERANRQINERLRALIAAYKTLGGSFTGDLSVDPRHLRDLRALAQPDAPTDPQAPATALDLSREASAGSDRTRRIRDVVEAALSDIILLGTEAQARLAAQAAADLVAGRPVPTQALVASLRDFIREALDLDPLPGDLVIPQQGPARPSAAGGRGKAENEGGRQGNGGSGGGGMAMGGGMGGGSGADMPEAAHHAAP